MHLASPSLSRNGKRVFLVRILAGGVGTRNGLIDCASSTLVCVLPCVRVAVMMGSYSLDLRGLPETMSQLQSIQSHRRSLPGRKHNLGGDPTYLLLLPYQFTGFVQLAFFG